MASTDAKPIPQKNVAYRITFPIFDADGDLVTGATGLDSEVSIDGGTFADCTNEATEIATNSGMYYLDLTSSEMNGDTIAVIIKTSSSGAKTTPIVMYPEEAGDIRVNVTQFGGSNGTFSSGRPEVNMTHISGSAVSTSTAQLGVNVVNWKGSAAATVDSAGYPVVTIKNGTGAGEIATSGGVANADVIKISGDSIAADNAESFFDGTGYAGTNNVIPTVTTVNGLAANIVNASALASDAVTEIQTGLATDTALSTVASYIDTEVAAIKAKTDQLTFTTANKVDARTFTNDDKTGYSLSAGQLFIKKNTALSAFMFVMTDSTNHVPTTGLTVTATRSIDGAAFGSCANAVSEVASGVYKIDLAAADLNGTNIMLRFTATGADDILVSITTQA